MFEKKITICMFSLVPNFCDIKDSIYSLFTNLHWKIIKGEGLFGLLDDEGQKLFLETFENHCRYHGIFENFVF
jgi:hypothetical protein